MGKGQSKSARVPSFVDEGSVERGFNTSDRPGSGFSATWETQLGPLTPGDRSHFIQHPAQPCRQAWYLYYTVLYCVQFYLHK